MKGLRFIHAIYQEVDAYFEELRSNEKGKGNDQASQRIEIKQSINDQAYFLLCWRQLEVAINQRCRDAIRSRRSHPNWGKRRAWDLFNPEDKRLSGLSMQDRVALLLDRQAGPGSHWARVQQYYELRNQIAHGAILAQRIDIETVIHDFY
jgi:hypothetical protein